MFNVSPLVRNLIIINVAIFLAQNLLSNIHLKEYLSLWSVHSPNFKPYQFFTYMFAHGGFGHIFFNMLALASFAPILESYWGDFKSPGLGQEKEAQADEAHQPGGPTNQENGHVIKSFAYGFCFDVQRHRGIRAMHV